MKRTVLIGLLTLSGLVLLPGAMVHGTTVPSSIISQELQRVRYGYASQLIVADVPFADTSAKISSKGPAAPNYKSPGKAFLMSLLVPGAGQFYYGSKVKAALFLGIEVATIGMSLKYHNDGNSLTTDFENYNAQYWKQSRYIDYLRQAYGNSAINSDADSSLASKEEISHHLPPFGDGQYYEMSGKYNQFAWGWTDAGMLGTGDTLYQPGFIPQPITDSTKTPYSARRLIYEGMRHAANDKFSQATAMLMATLLNHVVSAFEAYITTRRHNSGPGKGASEFSSHIDVNAQLKSIYSRHDTPYVKVTYKF